MSKELVTYQDLSNDIELAKKNDQLNQLLNMPPRDAWLKTYPAFMKVKDAQGKQGKYLPVDKHEWLMTVIFQQWKREILHTQLIGNSVVVTMRVHYKHPVTGEWLFHDGVGAKSLQVDAGADANDASAMKHNAVEIGAPNAASRAFKDACECLGKLFGKDLNKKDTLDFKSMYTAEKEETPVSTNGTPATDITTNF